ncbi:hypothetical protein CC78DRAFT_581006 [Neofusicoccum parvum]|nr:hypothetical protein CC78DRAFT_581006 [Neofusicoccum parvum]
MAENNVPRRLGYLEQNPEESRKSLARVAALTEENGNAITGRDGRTHLRDLPILPLHISAAVEGWRMWAWVLYDTRVQIDDIIQRMWIKQTRKQTLTKRMDDWRRARGGFGTNPREARPRHPIPGFIVSSKEDMKIMDRIYPLEQVSGAQSEESNKIYLNTVWKFVSDEHGGIGVQQDNGTPIWPLPPRHDDAAQRAWRAVQKRQQLNQNAVAAGSTPGPHELAWEVWARQNPAVAWGRDNNQTKRIATVQARRQQSGATTPAGSSTGTIPAGPSTATTPAGPSTATTPAGPSTATTPAGPSAGTTPAATDADNDEDDEVGTYAPLQHNRDSESPPGALPGKARKVHRGQTASAPAPAPRRRRTAAPSTGTGHGRGHGRGSRPGSSAGTRARSGAGTPVNDAAQFFGPPPVHPGGALAAHGAAPAGYGEHAYLPAASGPHAPGPGPSNFQSHLYSLDTGVFQNADDDAMSFTYDGPATVFPPTTAPGPSNFQSNFQNTDNEGMSFNNNEPPPVFPPTTAAGPSNFQSHPQPFDSRAFQNADDNGMSFNNNEPAPAFPPTTAPSPSNFQSHPQPFNSFQNTNNEGMLFNNNEPAPAFPPPTAPSSEHRHIPIDPALEELFPPHPPTQQPPPPQLQPGFVPHPPPAFTPRLPPTQEAPSDPSSPPGRPPQPTRTPVRDRTTRAPLSAASAADPIFAAGQQQIGTHLPAPQTPDQLREQNQLLEQALAAQRAGLPGTGAEAGQQRPAQQARHFSPQPPALLEAGRRAPEHMDAHRRTAAEMADLYVDYGDRRQLDLLVRQQQRFPDGQLAPYFSTIVDVALDAGGRACVEDLANTYMWRHQVRNVLHAETLNPTVRFRTAIILSSVLGDQIDRLRARGYQIEDLSIPTGESLLSDDNIQRYGMLGGQNHEGHEARIRYINTVIVRLRQIWSFLYPEDYAEGRSPSVASSISSDSSWHSSSYGPYHLNPTHRRRPHQQPPPSQPPPPQTPPPPPSPPTTPPADNSDNDDDSDDDDDDDNNNPLPTLPIPPNPSGPPGPPAPPPQPPQPTPPAPPAFMTTTQPQPQPTASAPPQPAASTPASTSARKRPLSTSRSPPVPRQRARLHSSSPPAPSSSPASAAIDAPLYTTDQVGAMFDRWDGRQAARSGGGDGEDGGSWDGMGKGKGRAE